MSTPGYDDDTRVDTDTPPIDTWQPVLDDIDIYNDCHDGPNVHITHFDDD